MSLAGNVILLYLSMASMLWLGGIGTGDTAMASVGQSALSPIVTISPNGSTSNNQSFFGSAIDESQSGSTGNIFGFVSDLTRVWTALKLLVNILTGPINFLAMAGLPDPLVTVFGAVLLVLSFLGIIGFIKGKDA